MLDKWTSGNGKKFSFHLEKSSEMLIPDYTKKDVSKTKYSGVYKTGFKENGGGEIRASYVKNSIYKFSLDSYTGGQNSRFGTAFGEVPHHENIGKYTYKYTDYKCTLYFVFLADNLIIEQDGNYNDCGFGYSVNVSGNYKKNWLPVQS